jgi:RimJ/RimL family protein N-acetyltransferase
MLFPHTESRHIALRPARGADAATVYEILFRLGTRPLPMIDAFVEVFGRGLSACFLVVRRDTDEVVGFSTLTDLAAAGHVQADIALSAGQPDEIRTEASALTVNFAFAMWRTRKVYIHTTDPEPASFGIGQERASLLTVEARLPDHTFFHGRLWDVHIVAVHREEWDTHGTDLIKQIV